MERTGQSAPPAPAHTVLLLAQDAPAGQLVTRYLLAMRAVALPAITIDHAVAVAERVEVDLVVVHDTPAGPDDLARMSRGGTIPVVVVGSSTLTPSRGVDVVAVGEPFEIALAVQQRLLAVDRGLSRWGPLALDARRHHATWNGHPLHLTPAQFRIMSVLVQARGCVVPRAELCRQAMEGVGPGDYERLDAHLRRVRRVIEPNPTRPEFLVTVRGAGVLLTERTWPEPPRRQVEIGVASLTDRVAAL